MEGPSRRRKTPQPGITGLRARAPFAAEVPLLLAIFFAPLAAGYQDPLPALLLGGLVWFSLLLRVTLPGQEPIARPRAWWLVLLFPLLGALTFVWSANRGATVIQTVQYASYAAALWLAADITRRGGALRLIAAIVAGALVVSGLGLREYLEHFRAGEVGWRTFGPFTNPNFFAGYLVPALLLTLGLALNRPADFKPGTWLCALCLLTAALGAALLVTGSRGAALSLGAGLVVMAGSALARSDLRSRDARLRWAALAGLLAAVFVLSSATLRGREGAARAAQVPPELCAHEAVSTTADSNRFRILTWQGAARMGLQRPLTGWGAGAFETSFSRHAIAGFTRHAHNAYLQLFAEGGAGAVAAWAALIVAAAAGLWRLPRGPEWSWAAGAAGALAAASVHNMFDSILDVPAAAFLTWAIVGMALARREDDGSAAEAPPASQSAAPGQRTGLVVLLAGVGLLLTATHAAGRGLLAHGRTQTHPGSAAAAVGTLGAAQALLPWDHEVALAQSLAYRYLGRWDDAARQAQRAIDLAPERPPGYFNLGELRRFLGEDTLALSTFRVGLEHGPNEIQLLYAEAQLWEKQGERSEAERVYRRMVAVEASPVGRVRALGAIREFRFARAHAALALSEEAAGRPAEAFGHRKSAACLLADRRVWFDLDPTIYIALGDFREDTERDLRNEEQSLWDRLAKDYSSRRENRLAELCREQSAAIEKSRERLEALVREQRAGDLETE